jgi:FMN phosphatase YigB (HAD superfamily)
MRRQSVPVYGLSNDVAEWARKRLATRGLDRFFAGWVFSSEVRAQKPQPLIYQRLLELLPCPPGACLFVDDRAANLDAARVAGLKTALFGGETAGERSIPDFASLTAYVLDATAPRKTPDERGAP